MADAKKCDRCGVYYDRYVPDKRSPQLNCVDEMLITGYSDNEQLVKRWELCPVCAAYLHAVLRIEPIKEIGGGDP